MKFIAICMIPLLARLVDASGAREAVRIGHPVREAILMLKGLMSKIEFEHKAEADLYRKFEQWCKTSEATMSKAIEEQKETISALTDKIDAKAVEKETLKKDMEALGDKLLKNQISAANALKQRTDEHKVYLEESKSLDETINAIAEALKALDEAKGSIATWTNLAQQKVQRALLLLEQNTAEAHRSMVAKLAEAMEKVGNIRSSSAGLGTLPGSVPAAGDYNASVKKYTFKSGSVIELLQGLLASFKQDLLKCKEEETNAVNSHALAQDSLKDASIAATKLKASKQAQYSSAEQDFSAALTKEAATQKDLTADSKSLADTQHACELKKSEWEQRSKTRKDEMDAMETAIDILAKVTGVRSEAPTNRVFAGFLQLQRAPNLGDKRASAAVKAIKLLRYTASTEHSRMLERLAVEVASHLSAPYDDSIFQEVVNEIEKMTFHLQSEQKDEDDHKHWCDTEVSKTTMVISDKKDTVHDLDDDFEYQKATVAALLSEIKESSEYIADMKETQREATEIREVGKKENAEALKDAVSAQEALAQALAVLSEFYKSSGKISKESYEFVQQPVSLGEEPSTWESSYTGVLGSANPETGILAILQRLASDFASMENEVRTSEHKDEDAYKTTMSMIEVEVTGRTAEVAEKTHERESRSDKLVALAAEKKHVLKDLMLTEDYMTDLSKPCIDGDSSYMARKAKRDAEIQALRQAETILEMAYHEANTKKEDCSQTMCDVCPVGMEHAQDGSCCGTCVEQKAAAGFLQVRRIHQVTRSM